ncbi:DNA repair protein RAD51 homolog 3 [Contarinia nasturtii]|uniref:DNA repair protein RAD51 homolog 3 n=1 Tax=Contarinia nasturtii TaxID=265458 RepID=UPI0012D4A9A6|nr:DNA repair protein RAD51 homolog 3 [Contarinia nasturtii]
MFGKRAYDVWKEEKNAGFIITLCREFDEAIGGGIRMKSITELVGQPGSGKTQFCLQLCVNVQIPKDLFGQGGAAVYIDTNRGFSLDRLREIAIATHERCKIVYRNENIPFKPESFTVDTILRNSHITFCKSYTDLLAAIYQLTTVIKNNPNVRLIVIDSFSYLFRSIEPSVNLIQISYEALSKLQQIADELHCAVVITNELTTRVTTEGDTEIVPALGESHLHRVNCQVTFGRDENNRKLFVANIDKCFVKCEKKVPFQITKDGVRTFNSCT